MADFPLPQGAAPPSGQLAGAIVITCATVTLVAIAHHPTVAPGSAHLMLAKLAAKASVDRRVHGTLVTLMCGLVYALCIYTLRRKQRRLTSIAGYVAYALGVGLNVVAALLDGFVVPALAVLYVNVGDEAIRGMMPTLTACGIAIQMFSKAGLIAMSAGIAAWSWDLLLGSAPLRIVGGVGVVAAAFPLLLFAFPDRALEPHLLLGITLTQMLWYAPLGVLLITKQV